VYAARASPTDRPNAAAFTLLELAVVVIIIAALAAIAVPRLIAGAGRARLRQVHANTVILQRAIDLYTTEHDGLTPAHDPDGRIDPDVKPFVERLLGRTDALGVVAPHGTLGPYLRSWPVNTLSACAWVRLDGPAAPQGCSWRFETAASRLSADHASGGACVSGHSAGAPQAPHQAGQGGQTVPVVPVVPGGTGGTGDQLGAPVDLGTN
jgi:type II secretory pathway pseudopilin PulG